MRLSELDELYQRALAARDAAQAQASAEPSAPARPRPVREEQILQDPFIQGVSADDRVLQDPFIQGINRDNARMAQENLRILEEQRPAPLETGERQLAPSEVGDLAQRVDWDADRAERMGLGGLAQALRERRSSPFRMEKGPVPAENLVEFPMEKEYGRFGTNPKLVEQELTYLNVAKIQRRHNIDNFYELPEAQRTAIMEVAKDQAKRQVARIIGRQEQRGHAIVDLDPEETIRKIRRGETAFGYLSPLFVGSRLEAWAKGIEPEEGIFSKVLAPFVALTVAGGRSVEPQEARPVLGVQKESKIAHFLRFAPSTVWGAWAFSDDEDMEWGSPEHIERIYSQGYDVTQEWRGFGEKYAEWTPWVDSDLAKAAAGLGMLAPIILFEPDAFSVVAGPIGKGARMVTKYASPSRLILNTVLRPSMKGWLKSLEGVDDVATMAKLEEEMVGPSWTPRWLLWRMMKAEFYSRLGSESAPVFDSLSSDALGRLQGYIALADKQLATTAQEAQDAVALAQQAAAGARRLEGGITSAQKQLGKARDSEQALADLVVLMTHRDAALRALAKIVESQGKSLPDVVRNGGSEAAEQMRQLLKVGEDHKAVVRELREAIDQYLPGATGLPGRGRPRGTAAQRRATRRRRMQLGRKPRTQALRTLGEDEIVFSSGVLEALPSLQARAHVTDLAARATKLRQQMVGAMPDAGLSSALARFKYFDDAVGGAGAAITQVLGKVRGGADERLKILAQRAANWAGRSQDIIDDNLAKLTQQHLVSMGANDAARTALNVMMQARKGKRMLETAPRLMRQIIREYEGKAAELSERMVRGTTEVQELKYAESALKAATTKGDEPIDVFQWTSEMVRRYGPEAFEHATTLAPPIGRALLTQGRASARATQHLLDIERTAWQAAEVGRVAYTAPVQQAIATLGEVPGWGRIFSWEGFLSRTYRAADTAERLLDPILSRGLASAPKLIRTMYRRAFERFQALELELNGVIRGAPAGEALERAFKYLTESTSFLVGAGFTVGGRGDQSLAAKALAYLKAVAKAGDDVWKEDVAVRALAWSAAPSGRKAEVGASAALADLKKLVERSDDPVQFLEEAQGAAVSAMARHEHKVDAEQVVTRFVMRGTLWAATQHDTLYDMMRATGPALDAAAAAGFNFLVDGRKLDEVRRFAKPGEIGKAVEQGHQAMAAFGLRVSEDIKTGRVEGFSTLFGGVRRKNELMQVAEVQGKGVWIPGHVKEALDDVPRRLIKELEQFASPTNPMSVSAHKLLRLWRVSVVNGWVFPRAAHFTNTFFGDMSQLIATFGWRAGMRITARTVASLPLLITESGQRRLLQANRGRSLIRAMVSPELAEVMAGGPRLFDTADGAISGRRLLQEAHEDGMWDSISTKDLLELTRRVPQTRWQRFFSADPPRWIQGSAKLLESLQHRIRVDTYMQARTGMLTGTPMARREAAEAVREALFDWRLGLPRWEVETVGKIGAFWTYKRAMMRHLGAAITEGFSRPGTNYMGRALTGRTKFARIRQTGQLVSGVPEAIYWQDPDALVTDDEQVLMYEQRILPWWADAKPLLMNRGLAKDRQLWYSEVAGRQATVESVLLPSLTTLDALASATLMTHTAIATAARAAELAGLQPRVTTIDTATLWERNTDAFADALVPGASDLMHNTLRPILGETQRRSVRGVPVPQAHAVMLHQLGWSEFVGTYTDADGRKRYVADEQALAIVARIAMLAPPANDFARNWGMLFNPSMRQGVFRGLAEWGLRWTGLAKYAAHDPMTSRTFEVAGQERDLEDLIRRAEAQAGRR